MIKPCATCLLRQNPRPHSRRDTFMPDPASAPFFRLEIARLQRCFDVISFNPTEAISQPFIFEIEILGDGFDLDLASLMFKPAYLNP
ncbi:hypothetical protein ALQ52_03784, partial [Pseudomonas cannabina pv. alisalensis]